MPTYFQPQTNNRVPSSLDHRSTPVNVQTQLTNTTSFNIYSNRSRSSFRDVISPMASSHQELVSNIISLNLP